MSLSPRFRRAAGATAEAIAAAHLTTQGYRILAHNIYTKFGEIDILAKEAQEYVCVEVRSRRHFGALPPELCLSWQKYQHLVRSVLSLPYLHNRPTRIDLITVENGSVARHIKNIQWTSGTEYG